MLLIPFYQGGIKVSSGDNKQTIFPFELYVKDSDQKRLFCRSVERVLMTELQLEDSFGCKIEGCHTHVGSKRHLANFVEAELLFHNSYYNKRFAFMTVQTILGQLKERTDKIIIVGYETFCELYVCEVMEMLELKKADKILQECDFSYCIYEQTADKTHIRNAQECLEGEYRNALIVYIVPINTTLTTHDKIMEKFEEGEIFRKKNEKVKFYKLNLALITVAPFQAEDHFWNIERKPDKNKPEYILKLLEDKKSKLKYLKDNNVYAYVLVENMWYKPQKCRMCFPDKDSTRKGKLTDESPRFHVDKASIVPMLRIGKKLYPEPLKEERKDMEERNLLKVIELSKVLYHHHTYRGGNHYQYYFNLERFFKNNKADIQKWLEGYRNKFKEDKCYNFIIAPRHYSNAGFVRMVNDVLFEGNSRIFYFDVLKEYRSNISAKYSDFIRALGNIRDANQNYQVYFHYVDDTILSGTNYMRAKSLIRSILGEKQDEHVHLFKSIIVLLNRNSKESQKSYIENINNFISYVNLKISSMRNHEDACILCRLLDDYKKIEKISATNLMKKRCQNTIQQHGLKPIIDLPEATKEERFRMIMRHIINVRVANLWWTNEDDQAVNPESTDGIYVILNQLYRNETIFQIMGVNSGDPQSVIEYSIAFIKVITRPFFTDHIGQRQASMRFCLEKLNDILFDNVLEDKEVINTLVKGLSDLGANYLIRKIVIEKILSKVDLNIFYSAVKKVISFSGEDTQSYLLECILINGDEKPFFNIRKAQTVKGLDFKQWLILYLENNKVLYDGFEEFCNSSKEFGTIPYYMEYFSYICGLNMENSFSETMLDIRSSEIGGLEKYIIELCKQYKDIKDIIEKGIHGTPEFDFKDLEKHIQGLFDVIYNGRSNRQIDVRFFGNRGEGEIPFKYFLLRSTKKQHFSSNKKEMDFFGEDNLREIERVFWDYDNMWIGETVYFTDHFCLIRISPEDTGNIVNDLFIQICYSERIEKPIFKYRGSSKEYFRALLFVIKIVLLFRHRLEELANKQNISNLVGVAYQNEIKEALKIEKAHKHGITEYYENLSWAINNDKDGFKLCNYLEAIPTGNESKEKLQDTVKVTRKKLKELFDIYMQVQANDYIVSLYRQVVLRNTNIISNLLVSIGNMKIFQTKLLPNFGFEQENGKLVYEIKVGLSKTQIVKVKMICQFPDNDSLKNKRLMFYKYGIPDGGYPFIMFMILLAMNAAMHGYKDQGNNVEIFYIFCEDRIVIENKVLNNRNTSEELAEKLKKAPWRSASKNITLWTLRKLPEIVNVEESIQVQVDDEMFRIILNGYMKEDIINEILGELI